jgi:hypothetical protein
LSPNPPTRQSCKRKPNTASVARRIASTPTINDAPLHFDWDNSSISHATNTKLWCRELKNNTSCTRIETQFLSRCLDQRSVRRRAASARLRRQGAMQASVKPI